MFASIIPQLRSRPCKGLALAVIALVLATVSTLVLGWAVPNWLLVSIPIAVFVASSVSTPRGVTPERHRGDASTATHE